MWVVLPPSCSLKQSVNGSRRPIAKILEQSLSASSGSSACCCMNSFSRRVRPGHQGENRKTDFFVGRTVAERFVSGYHNVHWLPTPSNPQDGRKAEMDQKGYFNWNCSLSNCVQLPAKIAIFVGWSFSFLLFCFFTLFLLYSRIFRFLWRVPHKLLYITGYFQD